MTDEFIDETLTAVDDLISRREAESAITQGTIENGHPEKNLDVTLGRERLAPVAPLVE